MAAERQETGATRNARSLGPDRHGDISINAGFVVAAVSYDLLMRAHHQAPVGARRRPGASLASSR
jgi:hypothetical protein